MQHREMYTSIHPTALLEDAIERGQKMSLNFNQYQTAEDRFFKCCITVLNLSLSQQFQLGFHAFDDHWTPHVSDKTSDM